MRTAWFGLALAAIPMAMDAPLPIERVHLGGQVLTVEVAATPAARMRGLMFRESLPEHHGMLFIWEREQPVAMWMKNTPLPLSVAFIKSDGHIQNLADLQPLSLTAHPSDGPVRYALEVNQDWFAQHDVQPGDRIRRWRGHSESLPSR